MVIFLIDTTGGRVIINVDKSKKRLSKLSLYFLHKAKPNNIRIIKPKKDAECSFSK